MFKGRDVKLDGCVETGVVLCEEITSGWENVTEVCLARPLSDKSTSKYLFEDVFEAANLEIFAH